MISINQGFTTQISWRGKIFFFQKIQGLKLIWFHSFKACQTNKARCKKGLRAMLEISTGHILYVCLSNTLSTDRSQVKKPWLVCWVMNCVWAKTNFFRQNHWWLLRLLPAGDLLMKNNYSFKSQTVLFLSYFPYCTVQGFSLWPNSLKGRKNKTEEGHIIAFPCSKCFPSLIYDEGLHSHNIICNAPIQFFSNIKSVAIKNQD